MQPEQHALQTRLHELAVEVGRLKRRLPDDSMLEWTVDRIAFHVLDLAAMTQPSAAELSSYYAPGDETAITEAIRIADQRDRRLRHTLALEAA